MKLVLQRLPHALDLPVPTYATSGSAGLDLYSAVEQDIKLARGARVAVPTGIAIALPDGYEAQIRPRSGLALRHGITLLNAPGTVDSDYRGEIMAILANFGESVFRIQRGMRIAQMVIAPYEQARVAESGLLPPSERGSGGFGSTGV